MKIQVEIKEPSQSTLTKFSILVSILYGVAFWGLLLFLFGGALYQLYEYLSADAHSYTKSFGLHPMEDYLLAVPVVIAFDWLLKWVIRTYRAKTRHLNRHLNRH